MSRSLKKGPFIADHLLTKIEKMNQDGKKKGYFNLVSIIDNCTNHDWSYNCCS